MDTSVHGVFVACLIGGFASTLLFAVLGGLAGHGTGHLHAGHGQTGHAGHLPSPSGAAHSHANGASGTHSAHAQAGHTAHSHGASNASHAPSLSGRLASAAGWAVSWLSPLTLAAAVLWFGGIGLVAEGLLPSRLFAVTIVVAIVAALLGAALVRAVMAAFTRASVAPLRANADGALGTLSAPIRIDAAGEVIYTLEGLRRSAAARSLDGAPLPRGAHVVIVRRERGVAWVTPLDPLAALGEPLSSAALNELGNIGDTHNGRHRDDFAPPP